MQKLIYGIAAALLLLIVIGFILPRTHRVEVTIEIDAQQATVFALVNDLRRFTDWSPWADMDPNARFLFSGARRGEGAVMTWDGTVIGSGTQVITDSQPVERVLIDINPGEDGAAKSWFTLAPGVGTTLVAWGFEADYGMNIVGRYFAPMLGNIVGREYSEGLLSLKALAESLPRADFSDIEIEHIVVEEMDIAYLPTTSQPDPASIADALGKSYFRVLQFIDQQGLVDAGAPIAVTRNFSGGLMVFDAAIPVRGLDADNSNAVGGVRLGKTYAGPVIRVKHIGSYKNLSTTHRKIAAYLAALGIARNGAAWESYVSDPGNVVEKDLLTYVYYPISVD